MIGRWHSIDPMIEMHYDYTPFAYVYNNPIRLIDPFGCDSLGMNNLLEMAKKYNFTLTVNGKVVNQGSKKNEDEENESDNDRNKYKAFIFASDVTGWVGSADEMRKFAGLQKLGKSAGKGWSWYGASFYGNKSTTIKFGKALKVGGIAITTLQLGFDASAMFNGMNDEERNKAGEKLIQDAIMAGIFAVSGEVGIVFTVVDAMYNTQEMQQFKEDLKATKEFNIPKGPLYFNQGK